MVQRRQRNQLFKLRGDDGEWYSLEEDINYCIAEYFSKLYKAQDARDMEPALSVIDKCVTPEMNDKLLCSVTDEEIKVATFQLGDLKAPGPEGFPGMFFQKYWHEVGEDTCRAVSSFFRGGLPFKGAQQDEYCSYSQGSQS